MPFTTPQEKFVYALGLLLSNQETLGANLVTLVPKVKDSALKLALEEHITAAPQQVANAEQVFALLEVPSLRVPSQAATAIAADANEFAALSMGAAEFFDCAVADDQAKIEAMEVACYSSLIEAARAMGRADIVSLLRSNLHLNINLHSNLRRILPGLTTEAISVVAVTEEETSEEPTPEEPTPEPVVDETHPPEVENFEPVPEDEQQEPTPQTGPVIIHELQPELEPDQESLKKASQDEQRAAEQQVENNEAKQ